MKTSWLFLTGEYPPQPGGVADYTRLVGNALVAAGDSVEVWAPATDDAEAPEPIKVHRIPDNFGPRGLPALARRLSMPDPSRIIFVQYVPHAFGCRAMNVRFCSWLLAQRRERIWTMFHEVAYPFSRDQPQRHQLLASVTHAMAAMVARASRRAFVSIPAWANKLRPMASPNLPIQWAPVPSNVDTSAAARPANPVPVLAHFGTYGGHAGPMVARVLARVLHSEPSVQVRLLGRGSIEFAATLNLAGNVMATGALSAGSIASELAGADVVLQPYIDGVTSRRSSLMAALALGRAIVTTEGARTESLWGESGAVALAPMGDAGKIADQAISLLRDAPRREAMSSKARALYEERFDLRHTIKLLREAAEVDR